MKGRERSGGRGGKGKIGKKMVDEMSGEVREGKKGKALK